MTDPSRDRMSAVSSDDNGVLRGFSYHDGYLDGVLVSDGGTTANLALRSSAGELRVLALRGLVALDVSNFREGNLVLNIRLLPAARIAGIDDVRTLLAERLFIEPAGIPTDAAIFLLESSFGADVVAICRDVQISEVRATQALP